MPCIGVFLKSSMAIYRSALADFTFWSKFFAIFTACSAFPLLYGYPSEDVFCVKSHSLLNCLNCSDVNCSPLSEMQVSGMQ